MYLFVERLDIHIKRIHTKSDPFCFMIVYPYPLDILNAQVYAFEVSPFIWRNIICLCVNLIKMSAFFTLRIPLEVSIQVLNNQQTIITIIKPKILKTLLHFNNSFSFIKLYSNLKIKEKAINDWVLILKRPRNFCREIRILF